MKSVNAQRTGKLIRQQRTAIGMTQKILADELNVTDKAVSKWENGDGLPDISILIQLAAKLRITTDELLAGSMNKAEAGELENDSSDEAVNKYTVQQAKHYSFITLILATGLAVYLLLNQIISLFSSWFTHNFIIDNDLNASIFTALPGLLLGQIFLIALIAILLKNVPDWSSFNEKTRMPTLLLLLSGFLLSLLNIWLGVSMLHFEFGSYFLIGLTLFLSVWQKRLDGVRVFAGLAGIALAGELIAHMVVLLSQDSSTGLRVATLPLMINRGMMLLLWGLICFSMIKDRKVEIA